MISVQPRAREKREKGSATSRTRCKVRQRLTEVVKRWNDEARARRCELGFTAAQLEAVACARVARGDGT